MVVGCWVMVALGVNAQNVREKILLDEGWKFAFGHAADPAKDFGCGTEYFNYLTKANSIHNEGPYAQKFDDAAWQTVTVPHDWVTTLAYAREASHSHGYKTVGYKYPETSVGWYRKVIKIDGNDLGKRLMLRFDGIFRSAQVWFNGFYMGTEPSGYVTQVYDITPYVKYGEDNLICLVGGGLVLRRCRHLPRCVAGEVGRGERGSLRDVCLCRTEGTVRRGDAAYQDRGDEQQSEDTAV